jgi:hypothetical protein
MKRLRKLYDMLLEILRLPKADLVFELRLAPDTVRAVHASFTKRHPRYKIIRNKTIGAALIDLREVDTRAKYLEAIKGRNCGAYHAKRARTRGYLFTEIDRNEHVDAIHDINTSETERQGRSMDDCYLQKRTRFEVLPNYRYYGVLDASGRLVAYATFGIYGNFGAFSQLLGIRNNDGIMHLLVSEIVGLNIENGNLRYIMYDTYFGAQAGLQLFKSILGFKPYHARYTLI